MQPLTAAERVRAFGYFVFAGLYFYFALWLSGRAASGLSSGDWLELVQRCILLFLLLLGYGAMGRALQRQRAPIAAMGLVRRPGWTREFGLGAALGWGMLLASILPMVLARGMIVTVWTAPRQYLLLLLDVVLLAVAALTEEIAFRGYPFQRLIEAIGPTMATLALSLVFGLVHIFNPGVTRASIMLTIVSGWLLSIAYLRTRALWLPFGWHFAWNASMGLLFGLPISGITRFSPVFQASTIGPLWMTGGDYGPEGSAVAAMVLLAGTILIFRITRGYAHLYAQPVIVPGGLPVDLEAMRHTLAPHHLAGGAAGGPAGTQPRAQMGGQAGGQVSGAQTLAPSQLVRIEGIAPAPPAPAAISTAVHDEGGRELSREPAPQPGPPPESREDSEGRL